MKNKTVAAWLAFLGGPLGLHRFYLHGLGDLPGWLLPIPTALGLYGIERVQQFVERAREFTDLVPRRHRSFDRVVPRRHRLCGICHRD